MCPGELVRSVHVPLTFFHCHSEQGRRLCGGSCRHTRLPDSHGREQDLGADIQRTPALRNVALSSGRASRRDIHAACGTARTDAGNARALPTTWNRMLIACEQLPPLGFQPYSGAAAGMTEKPLRGDRHETTSIRQSYQDDNGKHAKGIYPT